MDKLNRKYYAQGKEIIIGEPAVFENDLPIGKAKISILIRSEEDIEYLIHNNFPITWKDCVPKSINNISKEVEEKMRFVLKDYRDKFPDTHICTYLYENYPLEYYRILTKIIATKLDSLYNDHISKCNVLYTLDYLGRVVIIKSTSPMFNNKHSWKTYIKNIAVFRSYTDLAVCKKILKQLAADIWKTKK